MIPLESAYLCEDCQCIGSSSVQCECGSRSLLCLAAVLNREIAVLRDAALVVSSFEVAAGSDKEYTDALRNLRIALGVSLVQDEDGNESKIM